ncbi:GNAT family N-acetyltransferase [Pararhodobacter oceanensis]|uniref:N-acetyltransferase n=1 Tax=Pararhodobacter oceanensis TaxID=2172121 RepID=A0A2T8HPM1_9RHOB|nr:GNAT family N-acetyltransferase [Pararhodobacter oceanensis]PVH27391.1 N-acetyltransferase [Pararhodobacter oceanensis]
MPVELKLQIRGLAPDDLPAAVALLAAAMCDNPLHIRVFGADPTRRQRRLAGFLEIMVDYIHERGEFLGAFHQDELIGVLGLIGPGLCRPSLRDRVEIGRGFMFRLPPTTLWPLYRWLTIWARHDPDAPHWHIGPLAVHADFRRRGVGRRLMAAGCRRVDACHAPAWLETDLPINVAFYQTLGFSKEGSVSVLGMRNWFMYRPVGQS